MEEQVLINFVCLSVLGRDKLMPYMRAGRPRSSLKLWFGGVFRDALRGPSGRTLIVRTGMNALYCLKKCFAKQSRRVRRYCAVL